MASKILVGIPPKNHINLAMDEVEGLNELGYECETITYTRNKPRGRRIDKLFGVLENAISIIRRLHQMKPDILYLNSRFEPVGTTRDFITVALIRLFYWKKLNIAIKTHGSDLSILTDKSFFFKRIVIPYLTKYVSLWFFLSYEEIHNIVQYAPILGKKACVTGNIIDAARSTKSSAFLEKHHLNDSRFKFFFAGRMIAEKGIFSIIRAISSFKYKEKCVFVFAGNGEEYDAFKNEIKERQLENYVHLTGFLSEEECDHFYSNVNALVFPTYFDEGFPMALFKSVACGLPIITTKTRAAIDHLKEPDNCLWVDGRNPKSVAKALNHLYEDKLLQDNMAFNNKLLGQNFTRQKITAQMNQDFHKLN
ncbi:glycosyltransferase family 4 protein [Maribacter sp. SA7]|uniref:glycosyltransferase family 4 protein n=1 Tax=Maribacter zhoushanensis TaxID=3030012 RepID=UPI0023ECA8F1|nr:glycosyltransferase family 4 protein [Maribacter zhoushanensis]MDF4201840.1 glycosyltransferase family 4 protein [Maribacter zhoushanensis]